MPQIKMTVQEARVAYEGLQRLHNMKLPMKAAYWVTRLVTKLKSEYDTSETARVDLITELGTKVEGAEHFAIPTGTPEYEEFQGRFKEILETELDLDLPQLSIHHFGDTSIEPAVLAPVEKLLTDE